MIGFLSGQVVLLANYLLINVGGVGYEVAVPTSLLTQTKSGTQLELFIYTHVKEDAIKLFGFNSLAEKQLFELVLSVSGVGPTIALGLVGAGSDQLIEAIRQADLVFFTAIPRVGKKLAKKIIIELGSKLGQMKELNLGQPTTKFQILAEALTGLGFSENDLRRVAEELEYESMEIEEAIKLSLRLLKS